jgi:hypothetical protein
VLATSRRRLYPEADRQLVLGRTFFMCVDEFGDLLRAQ